MSKKLTIVALLGAFAVAAPVASAEVMKPAVHPHHSSWNTVRPHHSGWNSIGVAGSTWSSLRPAHGSWNLVY